MENERIKEMLIMVTSLMILVNSDEEMIINRNENKVSRIIDNDKLSKLNKMFGS